MEVEKIPLCMGIAIEVLQATFIADTAAIIVDESKRNKQQLSRKFKRRA
jgi:hypothetical protein